MSSKVREFYHRIVNFNQWFNYGRSWTNIPYNLLQVSGYISILLIFFGLEENKLLLFALSTGSTLGVLGIGYFFFTRGAEQVDRIMLTWRNTPHMLAVVTYWYQNTLNAIHNDLPVPTELEDFGITQWDDMFNLYKYILEKGKEAGADPICRRLIKGENKL